MAECRLVIIKRNGEDLTDQLLPPSTEWKIGRSINSDIRVRIEGVEDQHGIVTVDKSGKVRVQNFSVSNPLKVNGEVIQEDCVINNGDYLSIINRSFRFDFKDPLKQVTGNVPQLTSTPDQRRISGIENYRSSPRPAKGRRSTPGTIGGASRVATPVPSGSLYKSWRSSLSTNGSSLDKIEEDGEEMADGNEALPDVQQCLFAEEKRIVPGSAPAKKLRRSTRRSSARRSVAFGPVLSPEYFDKLLPPNTPLKKGAMPSQSVSFIGDQPPELEQIEEEEEIQSSFTELFSTPGKAAKKTKPKSPKRSSTPAQEMRSSVKKGTPPAKRTTNTKAGLQCRKSFGGVQKLLTKQKRSSLPASMERAGLIGVPAAELHMTQDSTDGGLMTKPKKTEEQEVSSSAKKMRSLVTKRKSILQESAASSNRSFVVKSNKSSMVTKRQRSLPSSVSMEKTSDTSVALGDVSLSALPEEKSDEESEIRSSLPTPLRKAIKGGIPLRRTKPKLWTPLRIELERGIVLRRMHQALPTPLRKAIANNPVLRTARKAMATPIRKQIHGKPKLRATKKTMATPIRKEIEGKPKLRTTKRIMAASLKKEIEKRPKLRVTKKTMATPLRKQIQGKPKLRTTKRIMAASLKKEIEERPKLRVTKKAMATPLRKEIESKPKLHATKKSMPTPLRDAIKAKPTLRATKKTLPTPLRKDIESNPKLRALKKSLPTPLKLDIKKAWDLRPTKPKMATPLQRSIKQRPALRKVMKSLPSPIRQEIEGKPALRHTKKIIPSVLKEEILHPPPLKATKKRIPSALKQAIESHPPLKPTKKNSTNDTSLQQRAVKRRQSAGEDDLPPKKKARAVKEISSPTEYVGLERLFKSPKVGAVRGDAVFQGVGKLLRTPKTLKNLSPEYEGLADLFQTPSDATGRKVKFVSPVAMTATRSKATTSSVSATMILNVPKLEFSDEVGSRRRRTRSQAASVPSSLVEPLLDDKPSKEKKRKPRQGSMVVAPISTIPVLEDVLPTKEPSKKKSPKKSAKRQTRSVTATLPELANTSSILEDLPPKPAIRVTRPSTVTTTMPEFTGDENNALRRTRSLRSTGRSVASATEAAPVKSKKKDTNTKAVEKKETVVEYSTRRHTRTTQAPKDVIVSPVKKRKQIRGTIEDVTTAKAEVGTRKRRRPIEPAERNVDDVTIASVIRKTRITKQNTGLLTTKSKKMEEVKEADAILTVVKRTRQSRITTEMAIVVVEETKAKKSTNTKLKSQETGVARRSARLRQK